MDSRGCKVDSRRSKVDSICFLFFVVLTFSFVLKGMFVSGSSGQSCQDFTVRFSFFLIYIFLREVHQNIVISSEIRQELPGPPY